MTMSRSIKFLFIFFFYMLNSFQQSALAWIFFGASPRLFRPGDVLPVKVDRSTSAKTQIQLGYYDLPYCRPNVIHDQVENIGEVLQGNQLQNSLFEFHMLRNESCKVLCTKTLNNEDITSFKNAIVNEYDSNMWLDDLPVLTFLDYIPSEGENDGLKETEGDNESFHPPSQLLFVGVPIGARVQSEDKPTVEILVNHWEFSVDYQRDHNKNTHLFSALLSSGKPATNRSENNFVITGFKVTPRSFAHPDILTQHKKESSKASNRSSTTTAAASVCDLINTKAADYPFILGEGDSRQVIFSYSVSFYESSAPWKSRWDRYFQIGDSNNIEIHWFGLANSILVVILLSLLTFSILRYTISKDITVYNRLDDSEMDAFPQDDSGWKLIHGDVFRRPAYGRWLAGFTGTGIELFAVLFCVLLSFLSGVISFEERGSLVRCALFFYIILGVVGGYVAVSVASLFEKSNIQRTLAVTYLSAFLLPGISFTVFAVINFMLHLKKSSSAIGFLALFQLFFLWFGVNVPLVFIGAYLAHRKGPPSVPVRTNQIPGQIPTSPWYLRPWIAPLFTGIFPFCAVLTDVLFIFTSIWHHQYYLFFGFILVTLIILAVTSAMVSIVFTYLLLSAENYRWWWPSFWASGSSGVYLFLYSIFYYTTFGGTSLFALITYLSYSLLISLVFTLLTGSVGFISSFQFVRKIYAAVKVD